MTNSRNMVQSFVDDYSFRLHPKTIALYQKAVKQLLTYCHKAFDTITARDIRHWLVHLETRGYHPSTRNTRLAGITLFYRYCQEEGALMENPTRSVPPSKVDEKLPYYLTTNQLEQLRKLVERKGQDRVIMEMLYATGVRVGELAAMKKEDVNWSERSIHIPKGKRKKARIVLFTRHCKEILEAYLAERTDDLSALFVNPYGTKPIAIRTIQSRFTSYMEQLDFSLTPHTLRHTFAAHLAQKGMPLECIQVLLGHEEPKQTQYYARLYDHARKQLYDEWM
ncbi:tyrosine-type recombinase/integrase [Gracilibacillus sp. YIM 98692]|uniref:tyrosine-type recombinase/integrase n=1 Tax=Gracilibacillus sp. YIM 98692 TaxID=2663532 RepID=UPI001F09FE23|nr:tyrosine-type recombinase/integrase [Gracilibacillus sp. YIM 98692]